jgi:hypothetical protein
MAGTLGPKKGEVATIAALATAAVGGLIASRYLSARKISGAERLADALLHTDRLRDAARHLPDTSAAALADCAGYLLGAAWRAAEALGVGAAREDPVQHSRTHTHPYTHATATVLTEATAPEQILTYAVTIPETGEVRGTRRVGALRLSGLSPARPTPDTVQITLPDGYTAQIESEFEVADYLVTGRTRLFGAATLRDNRGNVGRLNIGYDGAISGTITKDARVVGRFEGNAAHSLHFRQYQIEGG